VAHRDSFSGRLGDFGCENFGCKLVRVFGRNKWNGWLTLSEDSLSFGTGLKESGLGISIRSLSEADFLTLW
jgi:hypothetical protein